MSNKFENKARLIETAGWFDIYVATYSPGDGVTRYRFIDKWRAGSSDWDYFGASGESVLYTALGLSEAWTFLRGFIAGKDSPARHEIIDEGIAYRASVAEGGQK